MSDAATAPWPADWWEGVQPLARVLWRGVEAQHLVATMKLVDSLDEQAELERLLEASKPPLPPAGTGLHYLLNTPFRYRSPHPSRFRRAGEPGIWYGAEELHTAAAEVAYWRWRFLMDSDGLRDGELLSEHTFFEARADGPALDLSEPPWNAAEPSWSDPDDYRACQALAGQARERGVHWLRYVSARQPGGHCGAVLTPQCLLLVEPQHRQTWVCKVTCTLALLVHEDDRLALTFPPESLPP